MLEVPRPQIRIIEEHRRRHQRLHSLKLEYVFTRLPMPITTSGGFTATGNIARLLS